MKRLSVALIVVLATIFVAQPGIAGSRAVDYEVTLLDYPGSVETVFDGANAHGQAVGTYFDTTGAYAFLYDRGAFSAIPVAGALYSYGFDINDRGDIVGYYVNDSYEGLGFLLDRHGEFTSLTIPGAIDIGASGINNAGVIVGVYVDGTMPFYRGFKLEKGVYTYPIDVPPPDPGLPTGHTDIHEINEKGQIVGSITDFATYTFAFLIEPDGTINYYPPEDTLSHDSAFRGINNRGQAVGSLDGMLWLYDRGENVLFDVPGARYSTINAIGAEGTMFGWTTSGDGLHGLMLSRH
jgi:uncharacterized membrane protein